MLCRLAEYGAGTRALWLLVALNRISEEIQKHFDAGIRPSLREEGNPRATVHKLRVVRERSI